MSNRRRGRYDPSLNTHKGRGILECGICGKPTRDHKVGARCPQWDGILGAAIKHTQGTPVSKNTLQKRESRAKRKAQQ